MRVYTVPDRIDDGILGRKADLRTPHDLGR
jgi:hypothetical protein